MMVLITYDINTETEAGKTRLRKIARECQNYGQRVQNSVFECLIDSTQLKQLQIKLDRIMDKEKDSVRYYNLGNEWRNRVTHVGAKPALDLEGPLMA